jgi:serine/threonine protein kinase
MSWNNTYDINTSGLGGGQGDCYIVTKKSESSPKYFLKELRDNENTERRARFYRETLIYQSIDVKGIPKIIETNANLFRDKKHKLYYVAEYIEGISLNKYLENVLSEEEVINISKQLFKILDECHNNDVVHRDIKPENIIIDSSKHLNLVDFGISYFEVEEVNSITQMGQEIGNRFLRLPEFSAGSINKRFKK